jgi:homoserine kinase
LALATHNFEKIAEVIVKKFAEEKITCRTEVLVPAFDGAITEVSED